MAVCAPVKPLTISTWKWEVGAVPHICVTLASNYFSAEIITVSIYNYIFTLCIETTVYDCSVYLYAVTTYVYKVQTSKVLAL